MSDEEEVEKLWKRLSGDQERREVARLLPGEFRDLVSIVDEYARLSYEELVSAATLEHTLRQARFDRIAATKKEDVVGHREKWIEAHKALQRIERVVCPLQTFHPLVDGTIKTLVSAGRLRMPPPKYCGVSFTQTIVVESYTVLEDRRLAARIEWEGHTDWHTHDVDDFLCANKSSPGMTIRTKLFKYTRA